MTEHPDRPGAAGTPREPGWADTPPPPPPTGEGPTTDLPAAGDSDTVDSAAGDSTAAGDSAEATDGAGAPDDAPTTPAPPFPPAAQPFPPAEPFPAGAEPFPAAEPVTAAEPVRAAEPVTAGEHLTASEPVTASAEPTSGATPGSGTASGSGTAPGSGAASGSGGAGTPPPNFPPGPPPGYGYPPPADGPRFGTPPPGGWGFAPGTDGYATRYGLARPQQGRVIAGVCAAIGRATNTDPVLWRVLFAVFTLAGGLGIVLYLLGWLLIPAEGDSGSPLEALFGRGRTSSNPVAIIAVAVAAAIGLSIVLSQNHFWSALIVVGTVIALVVYGTRNGSVPGVRAPAGYPPPPPVPPPGQPVYAAAPTAPAAAAAPTVPPAPPGSVVPPYRPPFAPHGPYQQPQQQYPPQPPQPGRYPYPGLVPPGPGPRPAPPAPRPPKQRSRLGLLTFSTALVACGLLGLLDVAGMSVPFAAYVAVALTVVGLGMVVGAWLGRARGLIGLGLVLAAVLGIATVTSHVSDGFHGGAGDVTWAPGSVTELSDRYEHGFGNATLDLSKIQFGGYTGTVEVRVNAGDVSVYLPPDVDVVVHAQIDAGNGNVLGQTWDGVNTGERTVTDLGTDGEGGGRLTLDIRVNAGQLEVHR